LRTEDIGIGKSQFWCRTLTVVRVEEIAMLLAMRKVRYEECPDLSIIGFPSCESANLFFGTPQIIPFGFKCP
jgi:hypothetical protein